MTRTPTSGPIEPTRGMRHFLICAGTDGDEKALSRLHEIVSRRKPDAILFAGCIGGGCGAGPKHKHDKESAGRFHKQFFTSLGELGTFCAIIPGPCDVPFQRFAELGIQAEVEFPNIHIVHGTPYRSGDVAVGGAGGTLSEHEDTLDEQLRISRPTAEYFVRWLARVEQPISILLLASPPTGELGGEAGTKIAEHLIEHVHPAICVAAGPTRSRGSQRVAKTTVVNPGRLSEGSAAWLDWNRPAADRVELLDI